MLLLSQLEIFHVNNIRSLTWGVNSRVSNSEKKGTFCSFLYSFGIFKFKVNALSVFFVVVQDLHQHQIQSIIINRSV